MKKLITILSLSLAASFPLYAQEKTEPPKTKKVCVPVQGKDGKPVLDSKTGKVKEECKNVKKHKKHEGTKVPDQKK